jgi:hypothetical protein
VFTTKGINNIHIETSEMKMMKPKKVVTPVKKVKTLKKKTPTKKDEIIEK